MTHRSTALLVALLAAACSNKTPSDGGTGGPPNICNSQSDAQTQTQCQLTNNVQAQYYIDHAGKQLWLGFQLPAQLTSKSLLQIEAGYDPATGSPVDLALSVLGSAGQPVVEHVANDHGQGAPGPISVVQEAPTALAGQMIFLLFSDDTGQNYDPVNPFYVTASVITDSDPNTEGVPTTVNLTGPSSQGVYTVGTPAPGGVLSTPGRVDEYAITIPSGMQRPILYFSITIPSETGDGGVLSPEIAYLMGYQLYDCGTQSGQACAGPPDAGTPPPPPNGALVAQDCMQNQVEIVNLDAARLVNAGDTYLLDVDGCPFSNGAPVEGDLRATYQLDVEVLPDIDPYDVAAPTPISLTYNGGPTQLPPGRISHQAQIDLYPIQLSPQASNTVLHYTFTPSAPGTVGRFPAITELGFAPPTRVASYFVPDPADTSSSCAQGMGSCPNTTDELQATAPAGIAAAYCDAPDGGPFCLYSYRQEDTIDFTNLQNFEGMVPVPAGTSQAFISYQDQEGHWADDTPYTLTLSWLPEGSENQGAYHWTEGTAIGEGQIAVDSSGSFPNPPANATKLQGLLTLGNGLVAQGVTGTVHGTNDYDALPSTLDLWEMDIPSLPQASTFGETWELSWQVQANGQGGQPPCDFEISPLFCDSTGKCEGPTGPDPFEGLQYLAVEPNAQAPTWYGGFPVVFDQTTSGGNVTDTVEPGGCFCFEPEYTGGTLYLAVQCSNRMNYVEQGTAYTILTAVTTYPQSNGDGGMCPTTDAGIPDGGTTPVITGPACQMDVSKPGCGGPGDQCTSNADCCSTNCNIVNVAPTGGYQGYGACE